MKEQSGFETRKGLSLPVLWAHPFGRAGLLILTLFGLMVLSHPLLMATIWSPRVYHPTVGFDDTTSHPSPPSLRHLLGTDPMGRDVLSQLLYGARTSFGVGLLAGVVAAFLATITGLASGYWGGRVDAMLMGLSDVFVLMPPPVILLIVGLLLDLRWPSLAVLYGMLAGMGVPAIIVRTHVRSIKVRPFVDAARVAGGGGRHIVRYHLLPFVLPLSFLFLAFTATGAVMTEAILSFLGRTQMRLSWGTMIWLTQITFRWSPRGEPWNALLPPVFAIMLFCGAFYMLGRAVEEISEPM